MIATDHAPHTLEEKGQKEYQKIPSGAPLVQHALVAALTMFAKRGIPLERLVEKMCHNPAILFRIQERGFLREGYYADIACVSEHTPWQVSRITSFTNVAGLLWRELPLITKWHIPLSMGIWPMRRERSIWRKKDKECYLMIKASND